VRTRVNLPAQDPCCTSNRQLGNLFAKMILDTLCGEISL
jgi:hypothetical protein